jgi:hypothetical protein
MALDSPTRCVGYHSEDLFRRRKAMKVEQVLSQLGRIRIDSENNDVDHEIVARAILQLLIEYIGNKKIEEAINDIPF